MIRRRTLRGRLRPATRDEAGFTLPELIVSIALETIIFGALATAFIVVLNGGDSVNENLTKSSDARFAANYIISDARNSSGPEISLTDATSCPDPTPPVAGVQTAVARFNWNSPNAAGTTTANITDYVLVSGSLIRRHCEAGALVSDGVLAVSIAGVVVSCSPITDCSGAPTSITVTITETPDKNGLTYSYTLTAAFRKLIGGGSSLTPSPPQSLIVFGSGGCGVTVTGAASMKVYGNAFINTADGSGCNAMTLNNGATFTAGGTSILSGGSCVATAPSVCPAVTPYSPALVDPYTGLAAPSASGATAQTGCTGPPATQTAQPGVYASLFSITGANTCTLASGIYILQAGFSLGNGAIVKTGAGGVLIYITGGAFTVGGGAALTLTAMTTGPYAGLAVWQSAADASTISFSNGGALVFNGAIYARSAALNIGGNAQTPIATAIVVQTVVITNSGAIAIGASPVALSITAPTSLAAWTVNRPYASITVTPAGGDGHYAWSATGLPNGTSINASSGVISGSPTVAGAASVVVTLNDALGDDPASRSYTMTINAALAITTASPLPGGQKAAPYTTTLTASGGTAAFVWSATGTPAGLSIDTSTGVISGTPTAIGTSTITVTLADAAGASVSKDLSLTIAPAAPTISSVTLANAGATAGRIEKGDTITVVFSAQMKVSSICSTWATDTNNQALAVNGDVTVALTDGAGPTHDSISVTSATCTFKFGTLDLGVSTYIGSGSATFSGSGASKSTVAWTASTFTLVITLGAQGGTGTVATVATSTPIYTPGAIVDSSGASLGNSPFTLAAGQKF